MVQDKFYSSLMICDLRVFSNWICLSLSFMIWWSKDHFKWKYGLKWSKGIWWSQVFEDPRYSMIPGIPWSRKFQLEEWTLIIQKSTVIPPSPMVLFELVKIGWIELFELLHMWGFWVRTNLKPSEKFLGHSEPNLTNDFFQSDKKTFSSLSLLP